MLTHFFVFCSRQASLSPMTPPQLYRTGQYHHLWPVSSPAWGELGLQCALCVSVCRFFSPYSITPNRMMGPASLSPYMPSPLSTYQVSLWEWRVFDRCDKLFSSLKSLIIDLVRSVLWTKVSSSSTSELWLKVLTAVKNYFKMCTFTSLMHFFLNHKLSRSVVIWACHYIDCQLFLISAATQSVLDPSSVVHNAAHSECLSS